MSSPITLIMFCTQAGFTAGQPKKPNQNLSFSIPPKSDKVDDDNAEIFVDPNQRGGSINLNNVDPKIVATFAGAPRVKVTIETIEE